MIDPFFAALAGGELRVVTSTITLVEVLTQPLRQGAGELARQYRDLILATEGLDVQPVSAAIAEEAARLRAVRALRTPDAIQRRASLVLKHSTRDRSHEQGAWRRTGSHRAMASVGGC